MKELQLRDIHLPDSSLWWPPAPGWWLLALLLLIAFILLPWLIRLLKHRSLRALSLQQLKQLRQAVKEGQSEKAALRELSALMRRILITHRGRENIASMSGDDWLAQIEQLAPTDVFSAQQLQLLSHERYRRNYDVDIEALLQSCENWIRALPRRHIDVSA